MNPNLQTELDEALRSQLQQPFETLGLRPMDRPAPAVVAGPAPRRMGVELPPTADLEVLSLLRDPAGVLRWEPTASPLSLAPNLRRAGRATLPAGTVVQQFAYQAIPPNQVVATLDRLDGWLTPRTKPENGRTPTPLRQFNPATGKLDDFPDGSRAAGKRVLLFIHGTFSNTENVFKGMAAAPNGAAFLAAAAARYDLVLTFDHPTVGVSPAMNAFDLAAQLRPLPQSIDIVCHSRGGLVTRWFLEGFADDALRHNARAVLVGSTIGGTSLASPARLRAAMDYLANVGEVLGHITKLGSAHPFLAAAGVIMQVFTSITSFAAKTPVFDAAIALIPGLHGQSRVGNNHEITRLRANTGAGFAQSGLRYYAVTADFQPVDPGWNFLQYFSKPMQRLANWGADLVFDSPNDLVADVVSMTDIADNVLIQDVQDFGRTSRVHHTNYFEQRETIDFIRQSFGV